MKTLSMYAIIFVTIGLAAPLPATGCCRHNHDCADGYHCPYDGPGAAQGNQHCWANGRAFDLQTAEGKISEIDYLPGATSESGMVEVQLVSGGQTQRITLAPVGFLKKGGLLLHEGDTIMVKGFNVAGMEGDLLVATELHKGQQTLALRDLRGRPTW